MADLIFRVDGTPIQQGSKIPGIRKDGTSFLREAKGEKLVPWRKKISAVAKNIWTEQLIDGPVWLEITFFMPRPKTVKRELPAVKPDLDKLVRAVCDALKGVVYTDDSRVVRIVASKEYADETTQGRSGVLIRVLSYP